MKDEGRKEGLYEGQKEIRKERLYNRKKKEGLYDRRKVGR
jgi:hypothetical protein